jgi:nucleotide-binding universal stress UspA family protein
MTSTAAHATPCTAPHGPHRVLLATDGSAAAGAATALLARLARVDHVHVTVLGVSSYELALSEGARTVGRYAPSAARRRIADAVAGAGDALRGAGLAVDTVVAHDDAVLRILEAIDDVGADLVVLGARPWRRPGLGGLLDRRTAAHRPPADADDADHASPLNSVSTTVLRRTDVPTLVVHGAPLRSEAPPRPLVLIGTDGTAAAAAAVQALAAVVDPGRVDVTVVAVTEPDPHVDVRLSSAGGPTIAVGTRIATVSGERAVEVRADRHRAARDAADAASGVLGAAGFDVHREVADGDPAAVLLDRIRRDGVDLAVVGSRGLGAVQRTLLGSVSEALAHAAPATLVAHAPTTD